MRGSYCNSDFFLQVSLVCNLSFDATKIVTVVNGDVGVVGIDFTGIKCFLCDNSMCAHVLYIKSLQSNDATAPACVAEFFEIQNNPKRQRKSIGISTKLIPFEPPVSYKQVLRASPETYLESVVIDGKSRIILIGNTFLGPCVEESHVPEDINPLSGNRKYKSISLVTKDRVYDCACM